MSITIRFQDFHFLPAVQKAIAPAMTFLPAVQLPAVQRASLQDFHFRFQDFHFLADPDLPAVQKQTAPASFGAGLRLDGPIVANPVPVPNYDWWGSAIDDIYTGTPGPNWLNGGAGNDTINGAGGDDRIEGGPGNDTLNGGSGNDTLEGGEETDWIFGGSGDDDILGFGGDDQIDGGAGNDTIWGGLGPDTIAGGDGDDILYGSHGTYDEAGNDTLWGGAGNDTLYGGAGMDTLIGGLGKDNLIGGFGADRFWFGSIAESGPTVATADVIWDFTIGWDKIDLSAIDANVLVAGNNAFTFIGGGAFTGQAGQLRAQYPVIEGNWYDGYTAWTLVQADVNGDKVADFGIKVMLEVDWVGDLWNGHPTTGALGASDFIL